MARAYYAEKLSQHRAITPEGFLIIRDQTLGCAGHQDYHGSRELGIEVDGIVPVYRSPSEVTDPKHIASLEGKPVTLRHPAKFVDSNSATWSAKGHIHNVRVGPKNSDGNVTLIADIFIYDQTLIDMIQSKQLQSISLGYKYDLAEGPNGYEQRNLIGNHCAIVERGRAGKAVQINDADLEEEMSPEVMAALDRLSAILERVCDRLESDDADPIDESLNEEETREAKRKGSVRSSDDDKDYDDPGYDPNHFGTNVIPSPEGGEPINPTRARDALRELRKLRPFIDSTGDRKTIDAYNSAMRSVKAELARGEQYQYNPSASAYDAHLKVRRDADSFDATMSRYHRKRLDEMTAAPEQQSAADSGKRELTFDQAVAKAKADCERRYTPKKD